MSTLFRPDDDDEQSKRAALWSRGARREDETNRLQQAVIEAAQRLRHGFAGSSYETRLQPHGHPAIGFGLAHALSGPDLDQQDPGPDRYPHNDVEEARRRLWAGLMPKSMAPPPRETVRLPSLGTTTGVVGAVAIAAGIAWAIVNVMQLPINSLLGTNEDDIRRIQSHLTAALGAPITSTESKTQAADALLAPAGTLIAGAPTAQIGSTNLSAPTAGAAAAELRRALSRSDLLPSDLLPSAVLPSAPQPSQETEPVRSEIAAAKTAAAADYQPSISLTRNEIASLLRRGQDLIAAGDFASARLILTHLAEAGNAEASFMLAGTLDPAVLATRRIVGVQADAERARIWYARAAEQGSSEARRRLDQPALR